MMSNADFDGLVVQWLDSQEETLSRVVKLKVFHNPAEIAEAHLSLAPLQRRLQAHRKFCYYRSGTRATL